MTIRPTQLDVFAFEPSPAETQSRRGAERLTVTVSHDDTDLCWTLPWADTTAVRSLVQLIRGWSKHHGCRCRGPVARSQTVPPPTPWEE